MRSKILSLILAFSITTQPLMLYANSSQSSSNGSSENLNPESSNICNKILYIENLDLPAELIEATHKYLENPENRNSHFIVKSVKKLFSWITYPIRVLTTVPLMYGVNYVRGDSLQPDEAMFHIYRKKVTVDGKEKELVTFLVGLPPIMKKSDRKKLDELASHFKKFGVPLVDPKIARKEFSLRFFREEYSLPTALSLWTHDKFMRLWNFVSRSSVKSFVINSSGRQLFTYPLYDDMKNLKTREVDESGNVTYKKVSLDAKDGQVVYLLNKHRPNIIESLDRIGGDARAVAVMVLLFSVVKDVLDTLDMGINHVSFYTTIVPMVTLITSRMLAGFINLLQDGKVPKLTPKNLYIAIKKLRAAFMDRLLLLMKKEKSDPSANAEELFERYHYEIEKDDYWRKALPALLGHEPVERDGGVIYQTNSIGDNIVNHGFTPEANQQQQDIINALKALPGFDPKKELKGLTIVYDYAGNKPGEVTASVDRLFFNSNPMNPGEVANSYANSNTDEPIFIMVPRTHMNGVHYQMRKNGFDHILGSKKPMDDESE